MTKEISPFPGFSYSPHCRKFIGFILLLLIGLTILSCAGYPLRSERPRGIYHRVKSGETLSAIARAYQVNLQDLAEINNISNPDQIEVDSVIFVPDASQVLDDVLTAARLAEDPGRNARRGGPGCIRKSGGFREGGPE